MPRPEPVARQKPEPPKPPPCRIYRAGVLIGFEHADGTFVPTRRFDDVTRGTSIGFALMWMTIGFVLGVLAVVW